MNVVYTFDIRTAFFAVDGWCSTQAEAHSHPRCVALVGRMCSTLQRLHPELEQRQLIVPPEFPIKLSVSKPADNGRTAKKRDLETHEHRHRCRE